MISVTKTHENGIRVTQHFTCISKLQPRSVYILMAFLPHPTKPFNPTPVIVSYNPEQEQVAFRQFREYLTLSIEETPEILTYKLTGGLTPHSPKKFSELT